MTNLRGIQPDDTLVEFFGEVVDETETAILFSDGTKQYWIPTSQIEIEFAADGHGVILTMPAWLAVDRGLAK